MRSFKVCIRKRLTKLHTDRTTRYHDCSWRNFLYDCRYHDRVSRVSCACENGICLLYYHRTYPAYVYGIDRLHMQLQSYLAKMVVPLKYSMCMYSSLGFSLVNLCIFSRSRKKSPSEKSPKPFLYSVQFL